MPRSAQAYLADVIDACDTIALALRDLDLDGYQGDPVICSAVERQFITIGEAINSLSRLDPGLSRRISHASMIVGFRNQLTHDYPSIDDEIVWGIAVHDAPVLRGECAALLDEHRGADESE